MQSVVFPAAINQCSILADGTMKLGMYVSGELPKEEMAALMGLVRKEGFCAFSESQKDALDAEIPNENAPNAQIKSPSQKLRSRLFVVWQSNPKKETFQQFYERTLEDFGKKMLDTLEPSELTEY